MKRKLVITALLLMIGFIPIPRKSFKPGDFKPNDFTVETVTQIPPTVQAKFAEMAAEGGMRVHSVEGYRLKPKPDVNWSVAQLHAWDRHDSETGTIWVQMLDDGVDSDAEFDTIGEDNDGNRVWARMKVKPDTWKATSPSGIDSNYQARATPPTLMERFKNACGDTLGQKALFAAIPCGPYSYSWYIAREIMKESFYDALGATYVAGGMCAYANVAFFQCMGVSFTFAWSWFVPSNIWSWHVGCGGWIDIY